MYGNIVIPVSLDEDRDIDGAIAVANKLSNTDARITFLHVIDIVPNYVAEHIPADILIGRRDEAQKRVRELAQSLKNAQGLVLDGSPGRTITTWAHENKADCIAVASHRPALSDLLLGSTAAWIVRHAHCAVHVIR